jgi:hypothetical protein
MHSYAKERFSGDSEQTSFYNNGHGIKEFIEHIKLYSERAIAVRALSLLVTTGLDYMIH